MASSSSSSSSTRPKWIYDVFLSFRGEDTGRGFSNHLYSALRRTGIRAFRDEENLEWGDEISGSLQQAIECSQIAIIIFSKNYASSRWCLDELVKIMECRRTLGQVVIPVFYHVDPSDVRNQRGTYGEAMVYHEHRFEGMNDRMLQWRTALTEAAYQQGYKESYQRNEAELIDQIVQDVVSTKNSAISFSHSFKAMASSSSSSLSTRPKWIYHVFLSFRGQDTRRGFTNHLYSALIRTGIRVSMDGGVERGEVISDSLMKAIEGSQIAIVIFSQDYASSRWCMDELVKILECRRTLGQVVLPVFYDVDPSDVRHQKGSYAAPMERHEQRSVGNERLLRYRMALTEAANFAGYHSYNRYEAELIDEIVQSVFSMVDDEHEFVCDHPVGIESRVNDLMKEWSQARLQNVLIIGLWGMGGIGKTTVAKAFYNKIGYQFERRSFLKNIREKSKQDNDGLVNLQKQLIYDVTKTQVFKIRDIERGKSIIQRRFPHMKALVVLDDVDSLNQLKALCGSREWFCPDSVIIITTRDLRLLDVLEADHKYEMRKMDEIESLEFFSWHAFKQAAPTQDFIDLSRDIVAYCGGLPLALEILGSHLFRRTIQQWKGELSKLESIPDDEIQEKLKISFDGLDNIGKGIFLDICCFFINKDRDYVTQILDGCALSAEHRIQILIERSLIKVGRNNKLEVHGLLRDMGREIIHESSPNDPEKRSRLWLHEEVIEVLTEKTGTKAIEGIALKLTRTNREPSIESKAFEKMKRH